MAVQPCWRQLRLSLSSRSKPKLNLVWRLSLLSFCFVFFLYSKKINFSRAIIHANPLTCGCVGQMTHRWRALRQDGFSSQPRLPKTKKQTKNIPEKLIHSIYFSFLCKQVVASSTQKCCFRAFNLTAECQTTWRGAESRRPATSSCVRASFYVINIFCLPFVTLESCNYNTIGKD